MLILCQKNCSTINNWLLQTPYMALGKSPTSVLFRFLIYKEETRSYLESLPALISVCLCLTPIVHTRTGPVSQESYFTCPHSLLNKCSVGALGRHPLFISIVPGTRQILNTSLLNSHSEKAKINKQHYTENLHNLVFSKSRHLYN